ncbi:MAG TPA: Tfp pilus assembly protein FimT/FimU [Rhodanobacteraceae bacterium]|nr:Tfp pilus assembly protein FimT/FimU [Rhodanobacteraceae bacterium]
MYRKAGGFTLIELLMTLAVAGILAMIGAPAMGNLLARVRESNAEASIAGALRHARTAAVMENTRIIVCPSDDGRHCRTGFDWQHGWIVAPDQDADGQPDAGRQVIAALPPMAPGSRIITSAGRTHLIFHPDGDSAGSNARFTICHARERDGKSVVISNSGRVRVAAPGPVRLQQCLAGIP